MSTRHFRVLLIILFPTLLIASMPGSARAQASSLFLKINALGTCGLSGVVGHEGEIILRSIEENIFRPTDPITGLPTATSVDGRTLKVVKDPDPCSPALFLSTLEDRSLPVLHIFFVKTSAEGSVDVATIRAQDVQVVGFNLASDAGGAPREIVTFALGGTLNLTVRRFTDDGTPAGSVTACWSFAQNKRC